MFQKRMAPLNKEMKPQGRGNVPALRAEATRPEQDHSRIESARSNSWAECRDTKCRHRADGETCLLTFSFIGLFRLALPVQTVDATPSGIKLFSKVVFMKQGKRFGLSAEQKLDVWRRWKAGQTLHEIGRAFGKEHSSIRCLVSRYGGIAPAVRRRALLALTLREREEISRGLASGSSIREIAKCLERAVSTVSREVARHGGRPAYRASQADGEAWQSALRPKRCLLSINLKLRNIVASKLILDWSPKQISGWLKTQYPDDESMRVSHETIYRSLFIQARGALKKELLGHLRSKRRIRRSQHSRIFKDARGQIVDAISIRERPAEIEDRAVPGHWEGDLIGGTKNSHIATLVERHSRFTALVKVRSKDTAV